MEEQKNKAKNTPDRSRPVLKFTIFGIFVVAVVIVILIILGPIYSVELTKIHQTSLPEEFFPTAESIIGTVPINMPVQIIDDLNVRLVVEDWALWGSSHMICIFGVSNYSEYSHSRIFVNGSRVRHSYGHPLNNLGSDEGMISVGKCIEGDLEPGLHLIEFHLRDSFLGAPLAIQQWAIEVE